MSNQTACDCWSVLNIEPTFDVAIIRRAYAAQLRTKNPEEDPEGFKTLREAFVAALDASRYLSSTEDKLATFTQAAPAEGRQEPEVGLLSNTIGLRQTADRDREAYEVLRSEFAAALRSGAPPADLRAALERLLASAAIGRIDVYAETEHWLIWLLDNVGPSSHPVLERIIAFFRVDRGEDIYGQIHPFIRMRASFADRRSADEFLEYARKPGTPHHLGWFETSQPLKSRNAWVRFWAGRHWRQVARFLEEVDRRPPRVRQSLDEEALSWWKDRLRSRHIMLFSQSKTLGWPTVLVVMAGVAWFATPTAGPRDAAKLGVMPPNFGLHSYQSLGLLIFVSTPFFGGPMIIWAFAQMKQVVVRRTARLGFWLAAAPFIFAIVTAIPPVAAIVAPNVPIDVWFVGWIACWFLSFACLQHGSTEATATKP